MIGQQQIKRVFAFGIGALILFGIFLRFYRIADQDFVFYDEGYYLNWSRPIGELISHHHFRSFSEFAQAVDVFLNRCLASGKTLWFILVDSRYFWGGFSNWAFGRVLAAGLGVVTLALTFRFAQKYFKDPWLAAAGTALLAILPSHVFYSRIGMQESLSTVLVLAGFYFYTFPRQFGWRTFIAGLCWGGAFFSNYRLVMLPILITYWELALSYQQQKSPDLRSWLWAMLVFMSCVFGIGSFNHGENTYVIFSWVFHQAGMAKEQWDWFNLFSYPYYFFRLETVLFGTAFFASLLFLKVLPRMVTAILGLVLLQMLVFSFASEKGARYICVVLPFAALTVSFIIQFLFRHYRDPMVKGFVGILSVIMLAMMIQKSWALTLSHSDYRQSAKLLAEKAPGVKYLSTQNYIQNLFVPKSTDVQGAPASLYSLLQLYQQGYRYLVVCPQAYISMTEDRKRFTMPLNGYLNFIVKDAKPLKTFSHFSPVLLERFVCDHNESLWRSVKFLSVADQYQFGTLRIYSLSAVMPALVKVAQGMEVQR